MRRILLFVCLVAILGPAAAGAAQTTSGAAAATAIVKTSSAAMLAVAQAIVAETWNPLLDTRVQNAPAGAALGAAWQPSDPRWQQARQTLAARMTRIFDAYARSNELAGHIAAEITRIGAGPDLDATVAALTGAAGSAFVRQEAKKEFIVTVMTAAPGGPKIGSAEWNQQLGELGRRFEARVGSHLPPDDGSHAADVEKLLNGPAERLLSRVWMFAIANATRQMTTALNLMVFDEQAAIDADVAAAIGAPGASARAKRGQPKDAFSLEKMATCQDSWLDWGNDDARVGAFRDSFRAQFKQNGEDLFFVPITGAALMGMKVARVYSSTIGMARGFSVAVDAPFETVKRNVEQTIGRPLEHCETGDGMRTCDLEIADKRTVTLMADATGREKTTLVGCFYFYEK